METQIENICLAHSPGPWKLDNIEEHESSLLKYDYHVIDAGRAYHNQETRSGFSLAGYMSKADAQLIAAAPELLKALRSIADAPKRVTMNEDEDGTEVPEAIRFVARKAIAKAEGRS